MDLFDPSVLFDVLCNAAPAKPDCRSMDRVKRNTWCGHLYTYLIVSKVLTVRCA